MNLLKCERYLAQNTLGDSTDRTRIWKCLVFVERGKTGVPGEKRKPPRARTRSSNKLSPHMAPSPGIEPGPHQ